MWKQLYDILSGLFTLSQKVDRQDKEIATLRQEMKDLTALVHRLAFEVQRSNDREENAREKQ
jgi:predicted  nucleic acid-binding Zn-ribbon protein